MYKFETKTNEDGVIENVMNHQLTATTHQQEYMLLHTSSRVTGKMNYRLLTLLKGV